MNIHDAILGFVQELREHEIAHHVIEDPDLAVIVAPDALGPHENGRVVMEISGFEREENDGYMCFEFLTSIAKNIPYEKYGSLYVKLNDLNKSEMLGCYGILDESGILFHRYTLFVPVAAQQPQELLAEAMGQILERIDMDFIELFLALE